MASNNSRNELKEKLIASAIILIIGAVVFIVLSKFFPEKTTQTIVELKPSPIPSQYIDYDVIKGASKSAEIKPLVITSDCPKDGCINNKPASLDFDGINKFYLVQGKFSRAYLYIQALVDYTRPLTSWDSIFLTINGVGGHLIVDDNSLPIPPSTVTELLYNLRSVSFYYNLDDKLAQNNIQSNVNLFSYLQDGVTLNVYVTLSSDRPGRVLKEASIYYQCFQGSECKIEEIK